MVMTYSELKVKNNNTGATETTVPTTSKFSAKKAKKALREKYPQPQYTVQEFRV